VRSQWDGGEPEALAAELRSAAPLPPNLVADVTGIIERVRTEGDDALYELSVALDGVAARPASLRVSQETLAAAVDEVDSDLRDAIELAAANIRAVAEAELRPAIEVDLPQGHHVSIVEAPVRSAGIYAPGGRASYPSSVLMGAIPARTAGVERIVLATPPDSSGRISAPVLAAAAIAGVSEIYALGGAHAVAALALGTAEVSRVDVVAGPGNAWVTEAKRQLFGSTGVDGLAGPSELLVVADAAADAWEIALDMLAQAEHGAESPVICVSPHSVLLDVLAKSLSELAEERPSVCDAPGRLVEAPSLDHALLLADAFSPEHLELRFEGAAEQAHSRVAGCVFVGEAGATAFGDYTAGSNHVLPTGGSARFTGPLGVGAFRRRMSIVDLPAGAAEALVPATDVLARAEGLPVHGESARARGPR
jgi:histidinol dehydrogenase